MKSAVHKIVGFLRDTIGRLRKLSFQLCLTINKVVRNRNTKRIIIITEIAVLIFAGIWTAIGECYNYEATLTCLKIIECALSLVEE